MEYDAINLKRGCELANINSNELFAASKILAEKEMFGSASSLLILSVEEKIKSFLYVLEMSLGSKSEVKALIPEANSKSDASYLYSHSEKFELAKILIKKLDEIPPFINFAKYFFSDEIREIIDLISVPINQRKKLKQLLIEFDNLDVIKKKGLYVDYVNEHWNIPQSIMKNEYDKLITSISFLFEILSPKIEFVLKQPDEYIKELNSFF